MVLTKPQMDDVFENFKARISGRPRVKRQTIIGDKFRWPNAIIPYELKENNSMFGREGA